MSSDSHLCKAFFDHAPLQHSTNVETVVALVIPSLHNVRHRCKIFTHFYLSSILKINENQKKKTKFEFQNEFQLKSESIRWMFVIYIRIKKQQSSTSFSDIINARKKVFLFFFFQVIIINNIQFDLNNMCVYSVEFLFLVFNIGSLTFSCICSRIATYLFPERKENVGGWRSLAAAHVATNELVSRPELLWSLLKPGLTPSTCQLFWLLTLTMNFVSNEKTDQSFFYNFSSNLSNITFSSFTLRIFWINKNEKYIKMFYGQEDLLNSENRFFLF